MQRLNDVIEQYGRWAGLKTYTGRIEAHFESDFSHSLENAKSLLEAICKEICEKKGVDIGTNASISQVLKKAFNAIGYKSSDPVTQISTSLANIGQQMGDIRNDIGITSHGKTLEQLKVRNDKVDEMAKELLIDTTVIIASFLIRNFENENPRTTPENKIQLDDNQDFNDFLDDSFGDFSMRDYSYTASEILFYTDNEVYLTELKAFDEDEE